MKALGLALSLILIPIVLAGMAFAESNEQTDSPKKDIKEIKTPSEDRTVKITSIKKSRMLSILHIVGIEVCAGREKLYSPELDLKSDRDSITVKVSGLIMPQMCKDGEFFIRANDPSTISVGFSKPVYYVIQG